MRASHCKSSFLVSTLMLLCTAPSYAAVIQPLSPETGIYRLILEKTKAYYTAWSYTKEDQVYDQAGVYYSKNPDNVYWDPLPPLKGYRGWSEYQNVIESVWKPNGLAAAGILFAHDGSFQAWAYEDVVWTTANCLVYAQYDSGKSATIPCRGTQIWNREDGKWLLVHEHYSGASDLGNTLFQSPEKAGTQAKTETAFAILGKQLLAAWSAGPVETAGARLREFYATGNDLRLYMPWAPHDGFQTLNEFQQGLNDYVRLAASKLSLSYRGDFEATQRGDIAWSTATVHFNFEQHDKTQIAADGRQTLIWFRQNKKWVVIHEHLSIPAG